MALCGPKKVCIGSLKYNILIQKRSITSPANVDFGEEYTNVANVWAAVKSSSQIGGNQFVFSKTNIQENITHLFTIRFRSDVDINNWILYREQRYNIVSIKELDFDQRFLQLNCNLKGDSSQESSKW